MRMFQQARSDASADASRPYIHLFDPGNTIEVRCRNDTDDLAVLFRHDDDACRYQPVGNPGMHGVGWVGGRRERKIFGTRPDQYLGNFTRVTQRRRAQDEVRFQVHPLMHCDCPGSR